MRNKIIIGIAVLIIILIAIISLIQKPTEKKGISVRLSWLINANQAGFLTAVAKGFYAEEGLNVANHPGGIDFPSIQLVASGSDDFGVQSGSETMISARAHNVPVKAIAILDKQSPYVYFSLRKKNIKSPKDFEGKIVAVSYGRPLEIVYRILLSKKGVDTTKITEVKKIPSDIPLFTGVYDVQPGFISDLIFAEEEARKEGIGLNAIRPADFGIKSYGYTIFTTDEMIRNNPERVERYLRATLKGWRYALENPEECIDYVLSENKLLKREPQLKALKARKEFILPEDSDTPLGWMKREVWEEMMKNMLEQGIINEPVNLDDVYTNEFLKKIYGIK